MLFISSGFFGDFSLIYIHTLSFVLISPLFTPANVHECSLSPSPLLADRDPVLQPPHQGHLLSERGLRHPPGQRTHQLRGRCCHLVVILGSVAASLTTAHSSDVPPPPPETVGARQAGQRVPGVASGDVSV